MKKPNWMPEDIEPEQIVNLYLEGFSVQAIIDKLGLTCTYAPVYRLLKLMDIPVRKQGSSGSFSKQCLGCGKEFISRYLETAWSRTPSVGNESPLCLECAPDKSWRQRFELYGMAKPQFDKMWNKQSGLCDLCELPLPTTLSEIKIDHCHKQGFVRALLHHKCNVGLHYIEDDKFLANAVRYIERHRR